MIVYFGFSVNTIYENLCKIEFQNFSGIFKLKRDYFCAL